MLVFTEVILIAQYTYQIPTRLHCGAITPRLQAGFEKAGLHGNAFRCIPVFCVYLAILMHTYSLVRQKVGGLHHIPEEESKCKRTVRSSFAILLRLYSLQPGAAQSGQTCAPITPLGRFLDWTQDYNPALSRRFDCV